MLDSKPNAINCDKKKLASKSIYWLQLQGATLTLVPLYLLLCFSTTAVCGTNLKKQS